jgi:hypothetical protein
MIGGQLHLDEPLDMSPACVRISLSALDYEELDDKRIWSAEQAFDIYLHKVKNTDIVWQALLGGCETTQRLIR